MCRLLTNVLFYLGGESCITLTVDASNKLERMAVYRVFCIHTWWLLHTACIHSDGGSVCLPEQLGGGLLNSVQHHKVFYKSHCVTNTLSSTAALATVKATEGGLLKFNNLNASGAILKPSSQLIGSTVFMTLLLPVSRFPISE